MTDPDPHNLGLLVILGAIALATVRYIYWQDYKRRRGPVCTCQGGHDQRGGVRHRANDCPIHGEEERT